jgi:hypothetical protein
LASAFLLAIVTLPLASFELIDFPFGAARERCHRPGTPIIIVIVSITIIVAVISKLHCTGTEAVMSVVAAAMERMGQAGAADIHPRRCRRRVIKILRDVSKVAT